MYRQKALHSKESANVDFAAPVIFIAKCAEHTELGCAEHTELGLTRIAKQAEC